MQGLVSSSQSEEPAPSRPQGGWAGTVWVPRPLAVPSNPLAISCAPFQDSLQGWQGVVGRRRPELNRNDFTLPLSECGFHRRCSVDLVVVVTMVIDAASFPTGVGPPVTWLSG